MIKKDSFTDRIIAFIVIILVMCANLICTGSFVVIKFFLFTSPNIPIWYNIYVWLLIAILIITAWKDIKNPLREDSMFFWLFLVVVNYIMIYMYYYG